VRSLALLVPHYDVELRAAGAEIDAEQAYLKSCHRLAAELGVAERFVWLGQVDRPGKIELLESIDLFAMPTVHPEAKGIPVLEAFAAGVPAVAPAHGTFPEYLQPGTLQATGLTHRPGDAADLAAKIALLLNDVARCQQLGEAAWKLARSSHTLSAMAAGHEAIYARLLQA
jgi:glycosyltransferase involved in cell wall biosynthesis